MRKLIWLVGLFVFLISPTLLAAQKVVSLEINGPIGPATQDYITRGIAYAESEKAAAIIIQLNTPGGLESSMRGINAAIINSSVPVITYVYPAGARAASAGLFIMYASHINAMAPGTNIGAASPVNLLGSYKPTDGKDVSTEEKKVTNDATGYIRSLAELRQRNADWGESAVRDAASISAQAALEQHVTDIIADDPKQLLQKINGKMVTINGEKKALNTQDWQIENKAQDWRYQFLSFLTNPNIAYILMLIAIYGLFFELSNPGLVLPGVAGAIALLLVLYAFQLMPINYTGLFLILLGIAFMITEVYLASFGVIGVGGVIAFIIGSIMLFDMHNEHFQLSWSLVAATSILSLIFIFVVLSLVIKAYKRKIVTGKEGLIGHDGVVITADESKTLVRVAGELWDAKSSQKLNSGDIIKVTNVKDLLLTVEPHAAKRKSKSGE